MIRQCKRLQNFVKSKQRNEKAGKVWIGADHSRESFVVSILIYVIIKR